MSEPGRHQSTAAGRSESGVEDLAQGVSQVFVSALGVGAALSRVLARGTARGAIEEAAQGTEPVAAMVHYGLVTVRNMVGLVSSVPFLKVKVGPAAPSPAGRAATSPAAPAGRPRMHRGATLRLPLSIENPGALPLGPIVFLCSRVEYAGPVTAGHALGPEHVRFAPAELVIQPHDFEKMTVFVDAPAAAAAGAYRAFIGSSSDGFQAEIHFDLLED